MKHQNNQQKGLIIPDRHPSLPRGVTNEVLAQWLQNNAKIKFTDEKKRMFSLEEISDFEHESSKNGREETRLMGILDEMKVAIKKGTQEALTFTVPITSGTKLLD